LTQRGKIEKFDVFRGNFPNPNHRWLIRPGSGVIAGQKLDKNHFLFLPSHLTLKKSSDLQSQFSVTGILVESGLSAFKLR